MEEALTFYPPLVECTVGLWLVNETRGCCTLRVLECGLEEMADGMLYIDEDGSNYLMSNVA